MFTSRDALALLRTPTGRPSLAAIADALGFAEPLPIDRTTRRAFGFSASLRHIRVAAGSGTLRAMLCTLAGDEAPEAAMVAAARTLARLAADRCWLLIVRDERDGCIRLAAVPPDTRAAVPMQALHPGDLREADLETFAALVGNREGPDVLVHLRWRELLGRAALSRRFYRELEGHVHTLARTAEGDAPADARRAMALLHASRLIFVSFLEAKGWLDADPEFLRRHFARLARGGTSVHRRLLEPLWFGTLNTPWRQRAAAAGAFGRVPFLNGGLFTRHALERRHRGVRFTDDALEGIVGGLFSRFRLTARESRHAWSDSAVDPEMLGRAFESLMAGGLREQRGAFYTPPALVAQLTRDGLVAALGARGVEADQLHRHWDGGRLDAHTQATLREALRGFTVLDAACGSGAFLVYALETVADLQAAAGDERPVHQRRRDVLTRSVFGVDVDPIAVWLCQLRLWLSVVVEDTRDDPMTLPPLPNLDHNIREGDALAGAGFDEAWRPREGAGALRLRYARAVGARKRTLGQLLDRAERQRTVSLERARLEALQHARRELLAAARAPDLFVARRGLDRASATALAVLRRDVRRSRAAIAALRDGAALPFAFSTHFPDAAAAGGFALVLGNPPWVRPHAVAPEQRAALRARFSVYRTAAWMSGAADAGAGRGFASQADLAALFVERAVRLTRPGGAIAQLLPAKLWGSLAGGGLRQFLQAEAPPTVLEHWTDGTAGFDAVVYPSTLVARRVSPATAPRDCRVVAHRQELALPWSIARERLALDESPGAPWLLIPPDVRDAFDALSAAGVPLARSPFARPTLGVKCGCNDAFLLSTADAEAEAIEPAFLRPLLRGEHLAPWRVSAEADAARIVWTHDRAGRPADTLPEGAHRRLSRWRRTLEGRSDIGAGPWWSLFRTDAARDDRARVVWSDIGRGPRAVVLGVGDPRVPLNTCYVVHAPSEDDAFALATVLNSALGTAWLSVLAEPARGGYRRFLGWTCARLPVPTDWKRARGLLAPIGRRAADGDLPDRWTLTEAALEAYGLAHEQVAALLSWHQL